MFFLRSMVLEICSYLMAVLPLLLVWYLLPAHRGHSDKFRFGILIFTGYLCGVAAVVGLPTLRDGLQFDAAITLIPFHHFFANTLQFLLNIVMFLPLGVLLPLLWKRFSSWKKTAGFGFLFSLLIEISQLFCFRITDLNDLLMNTLGAVLGWCIWKKWGRSCGERGCSPWGLVAMVWAGALLWQGFLSSFLWDLFY
ncbi:VanZ family protein [Anaerotignum sp.]